ncbi:phosphotransferase [Tateyamaria omphalii]|uniref:phosphotransferase n=1 Tax=Tateyamaria omphalii TaxID=299262 RepID=UPI001C994D6E|nr:phosphotransferase [Tateyamaria omphalii]MBY5935059.1 phosphotransferase [Tateyamaria omphalii]
MAKHDGQIARQRMPPGVWDTDFASVARDCAIAAIQRRSTNRLGDTHFIKRLRYRDRSFYLKVRHIFASSDPNIALDPTRLHFEYRILECVNAVEKSLVPSVHGFIHHPAAIVLEDLEDAGFQPILQHEDVLSNDQVNGLGYGIASLHTALNKSSANQLFDNPSRNTTPKPGTHIIHGDLNTKNILLSKNDVRFLDFENCRIGYREHDIGWCLGHILIIDNDLTRCRERVNALMSGYKGAFAHLDKSRILDTINSAIRYRMTAPPGSPFFSTVNLDPSDTLAEVSRALAN